MTYVGLTCCGIARGAGGNGTLDATGQPDFMPFGKEKKAEETLSGQADQVSRDKDM